MKLKFLEELEELRRNTLAAMSQNIKRPLMSMLGSVSALTEAKGEVVEPDRLGTQLESIRHSGQKLMEFCNKAMLLCELKDGKEIQNESVMVSDVVNEVLRGLDAEISNKQLQVSYKNDIKGEVKADHQLLASALEYIFQNAITFSPAKARIIISSVEESGQCVIACEDQGVGLVQRVFKETMDNENNSYRSGDGVGLNVAEIIAKLHGGKLSYKNIPTGGVKFSVTIPKNGSSQ
ncbi:MAG: hypothetical protein JNN05_11865 [Candidatus Omnitrophica bacterium]|nr:hypothetical protein [Candidatus Omnitrophota bacterium]